VGALDANISGASRLNGSLSARGDADMEVSGASVVELDGQAEDLEVNGSGASQIKLGDFPVRNADIRLSGATTAVIDASGTISASFPALPA
jgi:autotransporter translocation and assembly factor TamB